MNNYLCLTRGLWFFELHIFRKYMFLCVSEIKFTSFQIFAHFDSYWHFQCSFIKGVSYLAKLPKTFNEYKMGKIWKTCIQMNVEIHYVYLTGKTK